jgi:hypothetical protein
VVVAMCSSEPVKVSRHIENIENGTQFKPRSFRVHNAAVAGLVGFNAPGRAIIAVMIGDRSAARPLSLVWVKK